MRHHRIVLYYAGLQGALIMNYRNVNIVLYVVVDYACTPRYEGEEMNAIDWPLLGTIDLKHVLYDSNKNSPGVLNQPSQF